MRASVRVANPDAQGNQVLHEPLRAHCRRSDRILPIAQQEHLCWDPKDGELCLCRVKSGETLMEARSDTDVQIVRLT